MSDRIDLGDKPWNPIPRAVLRDARLSPAAKGGLVTLLSHDTGWVRSIIAILERENQCGRTQARTIMRELVEAGYASLSQPRRSDGRFTTAYTVYAIRQVPGSEAGEPPGADTRGADTPGADTRAVVVEALDVDPQEVEPKASTATHPRRRDLMWDVLDELYGPPTELGRTLRGKIKRALTETGATPEQISALVVSARRHPEDWVRSLVVTETALAKHWPTIVREVEADPIGRRVRELMGERGRP